MDNSNLEKLETIIKAIRDQISAFNVFVKAPESINSPLTLFIKNMNHTLGRTSQDQDEAEGGLFLLGIMKEIRLIVSVFREFTHKSIHSSQLNLLIQNLDMIMNESVAEGFEGETTPGVMGSHGSREEVCGQNEDRGGEWVAYFEHGQRAPQPPYNELDRCYASVYSNRQLSLSQLQLEVPSYWKWIQCEDCDLNHQ